MAEESTITRTGMLRLLTVGTFAGLSGVPAQASDAPDTVMIIRHAEKPLTDGPPYGVTADGVASASSLTVGGWVRAGALAEGFAYPARWALPTPTAIYASSPRDEGGFRAMQTVGPLAKRLNLTVDTSFRRGDEAGLAAELVAGHGARLISWEHKSIPAIVANLGTITPSPASTWDTERFDLIWVFTKVANATWHFRVVAQRLLAGDAAGA